MSEHPRFSGTYVALVTPFDPQDGAFDADSFRRLIEYVIAGGVDGVVPCGTTGEKSTLTIPEHQHVIETAIRIVDGRVKVIAGTGSNDTAQAASMAAFAKSAGADAALSVTPYYNKPTQEGLVRHYSYIAEKADFPIIVYNVPGRTSVTMATESIARLMSDERIAGVKDAVGQLDWTMSMVAAAADRPDFSILSGEDSLTMAMVASGAHGVISVVANEAPKAMSDIVRLAQEGRMAEARAVHYRILQLMRANFIETNPIPVKYAVAQMGLIHEAYRLPLCEMSAANKGKMDQILRDLDLIA